MYLDHFELKEAPFSITPDPRFVYLTAQHRDALAHLLFGINQGGGGGFVQLTGEVGTGKTTLCRLLMAQVPENVRIALVLNPMQQPIELLRTVCDELRILLPKRTSSIKVLTDALTHYLLESYASGLRVVLVIDEAQNLSFEALEQVRLLTNLETPTQKLLQIILLGQPELRDVLARPELRQLAQRITARFHLAPLSAEDTATYVGHRLAVAGRKRALFSADALRELHRRTQGYPRSINVVADRALLGGYARSLEHIDATMVRAAANEVAGEPLRLSLRRRFAVIALCAVAIVAAITLVFQWSRERASTTAQTTAMPATVSSPPAPSIEETPFAAFATVGQAADVIAGWWGSAGRSGAVDCATASAIGPLCARLRLNESMLRELDRPVALNLRDHGAHPWFALRRLSAATAQIAGPNRLASRSWGSVSPRWLGDAMLVVARPLGYEGVVIAVGAEGELVELIHGSLAMFDQATVASPTRYGDDTAARVRRLQDHYGLRADGLVGPETMALLVALQRSGPHLSDGVDADASVSEPQQ
ncbi:MAG: AAA family ATPase [Rhodanobacteraceae bacterium]|nr:AAA family ATPase [Rhodanobacteraceae bacterium]MBP9155983.1 AAA family ATPase [Xanthomonadales bacterium]HQW80428.1 AAA family ATPase [Pseudomonadota bacterium]